MYSSGLFGEIVRNLLLTQLLLLCVACVSTAQTKESDFYGTWEGVVSSTEIHADLHAPWQQQEKQKIIFHLHFGADRNCWMDAQSVQLKGQILQLEIKETSGGYCDGYWNGSMNLELLGDKQLKVKLEKPAKGLREQFELRKTAE